MKRFIEILKDKLKESAVPANCVGSGAIAGTGGLGGEPGVSKRSKPIMKPLIRRRKSMINAAK